MQILEGATFFFPQGAGLVSQEWVNDVELILEVLSCVFLLSYIAAWVLVVKYRRAGASQLVTAVLCLLILPPIGMLLACLMRSQVLANELYELQVKVYNMDQWIRRQVAAQQPARPVALPAPRPRRPQS